MMEREHNYGKVVDLVKFLDKMTADDLSHRTVFASMVLHTNDFMSKSAEEHDRGVWCKEFSDMGLPSFLELYLFIAKVTFDVIHESIRYRLDHRPKADPSSMSIKQVSRIRPFMYEVLQLNISIRKKFPKPRCLSHLSRMLMMIVVGSVHVRPFCPHPSKCRCRHTY